MEALSVLLALCAGNSPVTGEAPAQRPVTRSFGVYFDLRLNKWLSKQSLGWWFETPSRSLCRQCNVFFLCCMHIMLCWTAVFSTLDWCLQHEFYSGRVSHIVACLPHDCVNIRMNGINNANHIDVLTHHPLDKTTDRRFTDGIFKCIFGNETFCISIQISLAFVPHGPIDNKSTWWSQVMAWHRTDDKPLPEPNLTQFTDTYIRHYGVMG